ncbi:hypothetical protein C3R44_24390, partial [Mycobacterium tuberculosis]
MPAPGVAFVAAPLGLAPLSAAAPSPLVRSLPPALPAPALFRRAPASLVRAGAVLLVAAFPGRVLLGRRSPAGL